MRELISNSADALDKIRFASLTDSKALDSKPELKIHIKADIDQKVISIRDCKVWYCRVFKTRRKSKYEVLFLSEWRVEP